MDKISDSGSENMGSNPIVVTSIKFKYLKNNNLK